MGSEQYTSIATAVLGYLFLQTISPSELNGWGLCRVRETASSNVG